MTKILISLTVFFFFFNLNASTEHGLWSEFMTPSEIRSIFSDIKSQELILNLALNKSKLDDPAWIELLRDLTHERISWRAWPLLNEGEGYWPNKWNMERYDQFIREMVHNLELLDVPLKWIIFDLEPPLQLMEKIERELSEMKFYKAIRTLRRSSKDGSLEESALILKALVEWIQAKDIKVQAVTLPLVLHDMGKKSPKIMSAIGVPLLGIPWDQVNFMLYRPNFTSFIGDIGAEIIYLYAKKSKKFFKDRVGIDLGQVGSPGMTKPKIYYKHPIEIASDLQAVRSAGIERINIFSLDGIILEGGPSRKWFEHSSISKPPKNDLKAFLFLSMIDLLRSTLPNVPYTLTTSEK